MASHSTGLMSIFETELGQQWLNICHQIFVYSVEKMANHFTMNSTNNEAKEWMEQSQRLSDWNPTRISEWMDLVVNKRFNYANALWENQKRESPLILLYVKVTFHYSSGTLHIKIPHLSDFLHCAFTIFFKRLVETGCAYHWQLSNNQPPFINNNKQQTPASLSLIILHTLKTDNGKELCKEAVRTAFVRIVNPCIRIDSRPSSDSVSQIMGLHMMRGGGNDDESSSSDEREIEAAQQQKSKIEAKQSIKRPSKIEQQHQSSKKDHLPPITKQHDDMTENEKKLVKDYVAVSRRQNSKLMELKPPSVSAKVTTKRKTKQ